MAAPITQGVKACLFTGGLQASLDPCRIRIACDMKHSIESFSENKVETSM